MLFVKGAVEEAKCEDLEKIVVGDDPNKFFQVGTQLPPQEKEELVEFFFIVNGWKSVKESPRSSFLLKQIECFN